jgi:hypothetical protein
MKQNSFVLQPYIAPKKLKKPEMKIKYTTRNAFVRLKVFPIRQTNTGTLKAARRFPSVKDNDRSVSGKLVCAFR